MTLTHKSRVRDICAHPLGRDIIDKLLMQMNKPRLFVYNPIVSRVRISTLMRLAGKHISTGFFDSLLHLLNSEPDMPRTDKGPNTPKWWKEAVFYQIYPRCFGGGIPGITARLDYLQELGVDALWLSPVYDSPNDDNGYDIRDYYKIHADYGTNDDMLELIQQLHKRGMKLVMDLVINHTSDEHPWFVEAMADKTSPKRDYYFFRESTTPPNNWKSFIGGGAWKKVDENTWVLCLFSKKQMDLCWDNADMRRDICEMIRFWLDAGVDGFRLDVINYISKTPGLPMGDNFIGDLMTYTGVEHYFYGPRLHEHLREIRREAFAPYDAFSVGEVPGIGLQAGRLLTDEYRQELDLIFNFDHLETPGHARFDIYTYDARFLAEYYRARLNADLGWGWHTLFFNNHDNPRMVSKIDPSGRYAQEISKMLAVLMMTLRGTPFVFQGDELGAENADFATLDDLQDVESHGMYRHFIEAGVDAETALRRTIAGSRDHARQMMDWEAAKAQQSNPDSIYSFYKSLIAWRRENIQGIYGRLEFLRVSEKNALRYIRHGEKGIYCEVNLTMQQVQSYPPDGYSLVITSGKPSGGLGAYEARVYMGA